MESAVEAGAPAAAVPEDRCRPPPQTSGALLDEATAAANPFPCSSCRAFHNNDSGYCEKCSSSWLAPEFVAQVRRLQRRAYLALITLVMSYFETSDRLVLSVFVGSSGLIVLFYLLTQSVATASATWICGLVAYVAALLYLMPTIRSTVLTVEDIDKISSLFEEATKQSLAGATVAAGAAFTAELAYTGNLQKADGVVTLRICEGSATPYADYAEREQM